MIWPRFSKIKRHMIITITVRSKYVKLLIYKKKLSNIEKIANDQLTEVINPCRNWIYMLQTYNKNKNALK